MTKKISQVMITKGLEAAKSHSHFNYTRDSEYFIKLALIGATSSLVYRAHVNTRVDKRRKTQTPETPKGFYRMETDSICPNARKLNRRKK